jgi:hypothetical protein
VTEPLTILGSTDAAACEGDACLIPTPTEIVNRRLDDDAV